jgi:hypothetical protein
MNPRGALTPARPLAAQAHALRAAAMLLERAGVAGLLMTVDGTAFITIAIPGQLGDPATRAALVTALAAAADDSETVRSFALGCRARCRITGYGHLAGHPVTITTPPAERL